MSTTCSDVINQLAERLAKAGYVIHNGDAETGETVTDESGADWWWTWSAGGDVETGPTCASSLDATGDAMAHWFENAAIPSHPVIH